MCSPVYKRNARQEINVAYIWCGTGRLFMRWSKKTGYHGGGAPGSATLVYTYFIEFFAPGKKSR